MRSDGLYGNERGLFTRKRPNTSSSLWGACVVIILPRAWTDTRHLCNGASQPGERASGRVLCAGHGVGPARGAQGKRGLPSPGQLAGGAGRRPARQRLRRHTLGHPVAAGHRGEEHGPAQGELCASSERPRGEAKGVWSRRTWWPPRPCHFGDICCLFYAVFLV